MSLVYNTALAAGSLAARIAACRSPKIRAMLAGQKESLARLEQRAAASPSTGFDIWFHAASLGEFEQARPLIERLRHSYPGLTILLSFFSPSGYEVRKNYDKVDSVVYLPFDRPSLVRRFLDAASPRCAVFVKYEFWANYLSELRRRSVPTFIIDAIFRPSQPFFKPWGRIFREMLSRFDTLFVQDRDSVNLLASIGVTDVVVAGDTRFDRVTDIMASTVQLPGIERWLARSPFTLIVGSSWQPDEERYIPWINRNPGVRVIIAPHEFDQSRIKALRKAISAKSVCISQCKVSANGQIDYDIPDDASVLIVDCFGLLSSLYRFGNVAIVGGGFGVGIHNINEAAVYAIPVLFGPNHRKFKEASDLIRLGGAKEYHSAEDLSLILDDLLHDPDRLHAMGTLAGNYIKDNLGASDTIYPHLLAALRLPR